MRRFALSTLCVAALALSSTPTAWAKTPKLQELRRPGMLGVGAGIAAPAAWLFSGKYFLSQNNSLQAGLGYRPTAGRSRFDGRFFGLSADYLFEFSRLEGDREIELTWYAGPGAQLTFGTAGDYGLGVAGVLGLSFLFHAVPLDFAVEYRPTFELRATDGTVENFDRGLDLVFSSFGIHMRYYFDVGTLPKANPAAETSEAALLHQPK
ncbi:MAG: hypothetical protein AAGI01_03950 [Myxococcota bacterium]